MTRILEILDSILDHVRRENPYGLVLKGGTALAIHHLNRHRESEDLDFDVPQKYSTRPEDIATFIENILTQLEQDGILTNFEVRKKGMAATDRYHMNLTLVTYKPFFTKIDLDFIELPDNIIYEGELGFYTIERMFVAKLATFKARRELKDLYDIAHLLPKVAPTSFTKPKKVAQLIEDVTLVIEDEELVGSYKRALRELDVRFKNLKPSGMAHFLLKTRRGLKAYKNELLKRS